MQLPPYLPEGSRIWRLHWRLVNLVSVGMKSHENESVGQQQGAHSSCDKTGRRLPANTAQCSLSPLPEGQYRNLVLLSRPGTDAPNREQLQLDLVTLQSQSHLPHALTFPFFSLFTRMNNAGCSTCLLFLLALSGQHVHLSHAATQNLINKKGPVKFLPCTRTGFIRALKSPLECLSSHRSTGAVFEAAADYIYHSIYPDMLLGRFHTWPRYLSLTKDRVWAHF